MLIHSFLKPLAYREVIEYAEQHPEEDLNKPGDDKPRDILPPLLQPSECCPFKPRDLLAYKFAASDQPSNLKEVELYFNRFNEWHSRHLYSQLHDLAAKLSARWMDLKEGDDKTFEMFRVLAQDRYDIMCYDDDMDVLEMNKVVHCSNWDEVWSVVDAYNETYFRELIQTLMTTAAIIISRKESDAFFSFFELV